MTVEGRVFDRRPVVRIEDGNLLMYLPPEQARLLARMLEEQATEAERLAAQVEELRRNAPFIVAERGER